MIMTINRKKLIKFMLISYERKEGHHNEWWNASREAHSKRAELTSGLSVGMFVPMFVTIYLSMFVCKRVSRSGSFQPISNRFGTLNVGDVILACQRESLSGIC